MGLRSGLGALCGSGAQQVAGRFGPQEHRAALAWLARWGHAADPLWVRRGGSGFSGFSRALEKMGWDPGCLRATSCTERGSCSAWKRRLSGQRDFVVVVLRTAGARWKLTGVTSGIKSCADGPGRAPGTAQRAAGSPVLCELLPQPLPSCGLPGPAAAPGKVLCPSCAETVRWLRIDEAVHDVLFLSGLDPFSFAL